MSQPIEVDEETVPRASDNQCGEENTTRISSDPEHHSGSEQSRNSTKSLSTSELEQHFENGRRYCSTTYHMPNDTTEQTRLAIAHQSYLPILSNRLTLAHIPATATRILDIGTGTGDWAIAVAEAFPTAEIIATDITTAFQPPTAPPNLFFELDDASQEWAYSLPFDFIHMRGLAGAFTSWDPVYASAAKHLKPGGTLEIADSGAITLQPGHPDVHTSTYNALIRGTALAAARPLDLAHLQPEALARAGLSVVKAKTFDVPLGPWPELEPQKRVAGKMAMIAALEGLEAGGLRLLTKWAGWTEEGVRELCGKVKGEVLGGRAYCPWRVVVGRKLGV